MRGPDAKVHDAGMDARSRDAVGDGEHDAATSDVGLNDVVDAGPAPIVLVQSRVSTQENTSTLSTSVSATRAGDFIAVLVTYGDTGQNVTAITDNASGGGNTYDSADRDADGHP